MRAALAGRDLLAVMPTGSGKSIGYQLPALLLDGPTLVVSPLIALMKDQVDELIAQGHRRRGAPLAAPRRPSAATPRRAMRAGRLRLLYVAPERFASESLPAAPRRGAARPLRGRRGALRLRVGPRLPARTTARSAEAAGRCRRADGAAGRPPILAFTATATPEVRDDIVALLGLASPEVFVAGFDRPNLFLDVRQVSGEIEKRALLPELVGAAAGARLRRDPQERRARRRGAARGGRRRRGVPRRAGRRRAHARPGRASPTGRCRVVCATNAFGMGIDRPDVEAVVHFEIPGSLEAYYQEIGRGGRDGRRADATLLWNYVDVRTREFLIDQTRRARFRRRRRRTGSAGASSIAASSRRMIAYADSSGCYRATILGYFGERDAPRACGFCGNCARRRALSDGGASAAAQDPLGRGPRRRALGQAQDRGDADRRARGPAGAADRASRRPAFSRAKAREAVGDWIDAAQGGGLLAATDDVYRTLSLTRAGREVMAGRDAAGRADASRAAAPETAAPDEDVEGPRRGRETAAAGHGARSPPSPRAIDALREWRREEARAGARVPPTSSCTTARWPRSPPRGPSTLAALSGDPGHRPREARGLRAGRSSTLLGRSAP